MFGLHKPLFTALLATFCVSPICAIKTKVPLQLFQKILPNRTATVLEAGGHVGQDTLWMSYFWPEGTIHVFEPHENCFKIIQNAIQGRSNVILYPLALSNTSGKIPFYVDGQVGGASSLLKPVDHINKLYFHMDINNPIFVDCTTVDEWARANKVPAIDFFWIDVEGNELQLLSGATEMLKTVRAIYIEVNLQRFWHNCTMYEDLKKWMKQQGFSVIWEDLEPGWNGNAVFINNNIIHMVDDYHREFGEYPEDPSFIQKIKELAS